jgi:hypothetical protein
MTSEEIKDKLDKFRFQLPIDPNGLHEECVRHPVLYEDIGSFVMELRNDARLAKNHLEFVAADIKRSVRANPAAYGITKANNDTVEEAAKVDKNYVAALKNYSEKQYLSECGMVMKESVEQRKSNLRDAVTLFVHSYYHTGQDGPSKEMLGSVVEDGVMKRRQELMDNTVRDNCEEENDQRKS